MSLKGDGAAVLTSWTNGRKAVVELLQDRAGRKIIRKTYRPGFWLAMFREYIMATYVSRRTCVTPRVVEFHPMAREIVFEYVDGQRVLEWVLSRFGDTSNVEEFQSFHGLNVDTRVADAFRQFRESCSDEAAQLRQAILDSYLALHGTRIKHGSADPRNVIYRDGRIFIIDFDNARPSLKPWVIDGRDLEHWYGITRPDARAASVSARTGHE